MIDNNLNVRQNNFIELRAKYARGENLFSLYEICERLEAINTKELVVMLDKILETQKEWEREARRKQEWN